MYPSQSLVFDELFSRIADQGRGEELFGCSQLSPEKKDQALGACFGGALPEYYYEFPLMGDPWLDMLVLYDAKMLSKRSSFASEGYGHTKFFRESLACGSPNLCLGLEFDFSHGQGTLPGLYLSGASDNHTVTRMMEHIGATSALTEAVFRARETAPQAWRRYYIGAMPGRNDAPVRLGFTVPKREVEAYAQDCAKLRSDLLMTGFTDLSSDTIDFLHETAQLGQMWDVQMDVLQNCSIGPTLGVSFMMNKKTMNETLESFHKGRARALMELFEGFGLADSRWQRIPEAFFIKPLSYVEDQNLKTLRLVCRPNFAKVKWVQGIASPAKIYLSAKGYDIASNE